MENFFPATIAIWLTHYGSFALFVLLTLGIFAIPIPDETLMLFAGALIAHGRLSAFPTFTAAILGAITGISVSYCIGRTAGAFLIHKYGRWISITPEKMRRIHIWFERIGRWALLVGYFIPGVRHLTGYAAGITEMEYRHFALFSYSGATIWACVFLSLGYFVGDKWDRIEVFLIDHWEYLVLIGIGIIMLGGFFVWLQGGRKKKNHR